MLARWTIRPRLMGVPGVANVAIWGSATSSCRCRSTRARLRDHGVTLEQVIETTGNAQIVSPLSFLEASTPGHRRVHRDAAPAARVRHVARRIADARPTSAGAGRGHRRRRCASATSPTSSRTTSR